MFSFRVLIAALLLSGSTAYGASGGGAFGLQVGMGLPFASQAGLHYKMSDKWGVALGYNMLNLSVGEAGVKLSMPELLLHSHPFGGSYFLAAGVGMSKLEASATITNVSSSAEVSSTAVVIKTGWMWGIGNNGFFAGMDASYVMPSGGTVKIDAPAGTEDTDEYKDLKKSAEQFGETAYLNLTFLRLGWLF